MSRRAPLDRNRPAWAERSGDRTDAEEIRGGHRKRAIRPDDSPDDEQDEPDVDPWAAALGRGR